MAGYGDNSGLQAYAASVGYTIPEGTDLDVARQLGSAYIDSLYGDRFPGEPTGSIEQDREWPRTGATAYGSTLATNIIPTRVVNASYEAAILQIKTPGSLSASYTPGTRKVLTEVKGIKWEVIGSGTADQRAYLVSEAIDGILAPLLIPRYLPAILVV